MITFQKLNSCNPEVWTIPFPADFETHRKTMSELVVRCIYNFPAANAWGKFKGTGFCRAAAITEKDNVVFGRSEFEKNHAEEQLIELILKDGKDFKYMYCDIEPCHSEKYKGHSCKKLIMDAFPGSNGKVFYLFEQTDYEKGLVYNYLSRYGDKDTEITDIKNEYFGIRTEFYTNIKKTTKA